MKIGNRWIGEGHPGFLVAEAGANHEGSFERAKQLVQSAADCGADAIKFQHYKAEKLVSKDAMRYWKVAGDEQGFQFSPDDYKDSQLETFKKIDGLPREKDPELMRYAEEKGIIMFSTPFDFESVDHLDAIGVPMFKISSGDLTYHQLLRHAAKKGKPIVLSTGASDLNEIKNAVDVIRRAGNDQIILLHCILAYPTPLDKANLAMMLHLQKNFPDLLIGFSDHTPGIKAAVAASVLGAVIIEKHFTDTPGPAAGENKVGESPDHDIGIGPEQFRNMAADIRFHESVRFGARYGAGANAVIDWVKSYCSIVLGNAEKQVDSQVEQKARLQARRSIVAEKNLAKWTIITKKMISDGTFSCKRPGTGIPPYQLESLERMIIVRDIEPDSVMNWDDLDDP